MPKAIDITGQRFGKLVALCFSHTQKFPSGQTRRMWKLKCDCGNLVVKNMRDLRASDTKSCGCESYKSNRPSYNRLSLGESSFKGLFRRYQKRAEKLNVPWLLSADEFMSITKKNCYYCNVEPKQKMLTHASSFGSYIYNGIDRLDGKLGYVEGNVVAACGICNRSKNDMDLERFLQWIEKVHKIHFGEKVNMEM